MAKKHKSFLFANYGVDYTKKRPVDKTLRKAMRRAGFHAGGKG